MIQIDNYYQLLLDQCQGYTVQGLFYGSRSIKDIVTLQTGNLGKIFFFDQEPMIAGVDQELWDYVFQEPTIFANSELDSIDKQELRRRHPKNFIDWYFFSNALISREWLSDYRYLHAGWSDYKTCLFDSNLITGYRQYRLYLLYLLMQDKSHMHSHISFNGNYDWQTDLKKYDHMNLLQIDDLIDTIGNYHSSYDNFAEEKNKNSRWMQQYISLQHYSESNLILVAETVFVENKKHLTEKIFKPIATGKPFILAGGYKNLDYLIRYGFESFSELWDESYDNIFNPTARAEKVIETVKQTALPNYNVYVDANTTENYQKDLKQSLEKLNHAHIIAKRNRDYFWSNQFYELVVKETINNLNAAKEELASKCV